MSSAEPNEKEDHLPPVVSLSRRIVEMETKIKWLEAGLSERAAINAALAEEIERLRKTIKQLIQFIGFNDVTPISS